MVFGGDFRQTLPVVPKGTCQQVVAVKTLNLTVEYTFQLEAYI